MFDGSAGVGIMAPWRHGVSRTAKDSIRIWCPQGHQGLELMDAEVREHHWPRHFHETYAIGFNLAGSGAFFCRGAVRTPELGDLHFLHPGEIHTGQAQGGRSWRYRSLLLRPAFMDALVGQVSEKLRPLGFRQPVVRDEALAASLGRLFEALDRPCGGERLEDDSLILGVLGRVLLAHGNIDAPQTGTERTRVHRVKACIEDRFNESIPLQELARLAGLTPHHLIEVFQRETGVPPHAYQNLVRANRAKALLREGRPIAEVALACGYCDQSHLNRWFRRILGMTPRQFQAAGLSSKKRWPS